MGEATLREGGRSRAVFAVKSAVLKAKGHVAGDVEQDNDAKGGAIAAERGDGPSEEEEPSEDGRPERFSGHRLS